MGIHYLIYWQEDQLHTPHVFCISSQVRLYNILNYRLYYLQ